MNRISLIDTLKPGQEVIVLSAHCDDAEIGCGGLLRRLRTAVEGRNTIRGVIFTGGNDPIRRPEAEAAAKEFGIDHLELFSYPDSLLPDHFGAIKRDLLTLRDNIGVERVGMVLCPHLDDRHQDHRCVAENAWRVFRDHLVLEYEIPKYEGDLGRPNLYVALTEAEADAKVKSLLRCYPSQRQSHRWFTRETFMSLMRLRGVESNREFSEALTVRKMVV